jgi:hypothetical protein
MDIVRSRSPKLNSHWSTKCPTSLVHLASCCGQGIAPPFVWMGRRGRRAASDSSSHRGGCCQIGRSGKVSSFISTHEVNANHWHYNTCGLDWCIGARLALVAALLPVCAVMAASKAAETIFLWQFHHRELGTSRRSRLAQSNDGVEENHT